MIRNKIVEQARASMQWLRRWKSKTWVTDTIRTAAILAVVVNAVFGILEKRDDAVRWLGWDRCHVINPFTKKPDLSFADRPCLPGRITLIKWLCPQVYAPAMVVDRPNRVFQVVRVDGDRVEWGEQSLLSIDPNGNENWSPIVLYYMAVQGGELVPATEALGEGNNPYQGDGFIIRQIAISSASCSPKTGPNPSWAQPNELQFFIPNSQPVTIRPDTKDRTTKTDSQLATPEPIRVKFFNGIQDLKTMNIYDRSTPLFCGQQMNDGFEIGPYFTHTYPLGFVARDP